MNCFAWGLAELVPASSCFQRFRVMTEWKIKNSLTMYDARDTNINVSADQAVGRMCRVQEFWLGLWCVKQLIAPSCGQLTHAISLGVKMRLSRNILTGMVRMRTKGNAIEACVDMTAHRAAKHTTWMQVNRCMRSVRTWRTRTRFMKTHRHESEQIKVTF